jgi:hypothetical protein
MSWTVTSLLFEMVIVYRKNQCFSSGRERSAAYSDDTETLTPLVVASDVNIAS